MTYRNPLCPMCEIELIAEVETNSYSINEYHCQKQWVGHCPKCKDTYRWNIKYKAYESEEPEWIDHLTNDEEDNYWDW